MLGIDEYRAAQRLPLTDDGPALHLPLRDEHDGEYAAQDHAVDVAHVIGDNHKPASFQLAFLALHRDFDLEDKPEQQSETARQPADDFPAIGQPEDRDPQVDQSNQTEEKRPKRKKSR